MSSHPSKEVLLQELDQHLERLCAFSDMLHASPELGHQEFMASRRLAEILEEQGFTVTREYGDLPTAFRAELSGGGPGPAVALMAEYDALPDIGHACGHNLIAAASLGAALALAPYLPRLGGTLVVMGTPAEETDGAKVTLVDSGLMDDLDAALMAHPGSETVVAPASLALDAVEYLFHGRAAHAGSAPQEGINALDAVLLTFAAVNALRQHLVPGEQVHGYVHEGGTAPNVIPERASGRFYIRASAREQLDRLRERVHNCARAGALATGADLEINYFELSFDEMQTDARLAALVEENLEWLGLSSTAPREGVGSIDMGNVSRRVPSVHPYIEMGPPFAAAHTREFTAAAGGEAGHRWIAQAAAVLAGTVLDIFRGRLTEL